MRVPSDAERANRVAQTVAILGATGIAFAHLTLPAAPRAVALAAIGACVAMLVWIVLTRDRPRLWRSHVAFLLVQAAIISYLWVDHAWIAESGIQWVPFRPNQLGALTVALLAPPRLWIGVLAIVGFAGSAVIQFLLFEPAVQRRLDYGDPWATIAFGGFAIAILIYRLRATAIERDAEKARADAEAYERTARAILALRDLASTPLQTLLAAVELLKRRGSAPAELVERIERAAKRIADLEDLTRPFQESLHVSPGDEAWNPRQVMRDAATPEIRG